MASMKVQKGGSLDKTVKQPQNGAQVTVVNQTPAKMTLLRSHSWSGIPALPGFPDTILAGRPIMFTHLSDGDFGSTAVVIYGSPAPAGEPRAWVLAWDASAETDQRPNKVYVTCGSQIDIDAMTYDQIRANLNKSTSKSLSSDDASKTRAIANIDDTVPNKAIVGAEFGVNP